MTRSYRKGCLVAIAAMFLLGAVPAYAMAEAQEKIKHGWATKEACASEGRDVRWCVYMDCKNASHGRGAACEGVEADGFWAYIPPPGAGAGQKAGE